MPEFPPVITAYLLVRSYFLVLNYAPDMYFLKKNKKIIPKTIHIKVGYI